MSTTLTLQSEGRRSSAIGVILGLVAAIGMMFVAASALPYFRVTDAQFGGYWPRRWWLLLHIVTGMWALLTGPLQLWLGLMQRRLTLHRLLGIAYLTSVGVSSLAAYYLAFNTDYGWVFGAGLASLATAWLFTTGLAFLAVKRRLYDQHKEWMIRSYVVTTAFVTFRAFYLLLGAAGVGEPLERLAASSWFCWAVPLLITEVVLQGRKILRPEERTERQLS